MGSEREREVAAVQELLDGRGRMLLLEGRAGIGKTSLIEVACSRAAELGGVALAAPHVGPNGSPWPIVPGLAVAGGASGLFSTAQQLGGALGVALLGTIFFGYLGGHSFEAALVHTAPWAMGAFASAASCRCCCRARRCRRRR